MLMYMSSIQPSRIETRKRDSMERWMVPKFHGSFWEKATQAIMPNWKYTASSSSPT